MWDVVKLQGDSDTLRGPIASTEEARSVLIAPVISLTYPRFRGIPGAELEPALLPRVLKSCALSIAYKLCFLCDVAKYMSVAVDVLCIPPSSP